MKDKNSKKLADSIFKIDKYLGKIQTFSQKIISEDYGEVSNDDLEIFRDTFTNYINQVGTAANIIIGCVDKESDLLITEDDLSVLSDAAEIRNANTHNDYEHVSIQNMYYFLTYLVDPLEKIVESILQKYPTINENVKDLKNQTIKFKYETLYSADRKFYQENLKSELDASDYRESLKEKSLSRQRRIKRKIDKHE